MSDYQTYPTHKDAESAKSQLSGWPDARVSRIDGYATPADFEAGKLSPLWVIECASGQYLRTDGYVR